MKTPHHREAIWAQLMATAQRIYDLQVELSELVYAARECEEPLTWAEIGDATGMTRQAAWERFTQARLRKQGGPVHPGQGRLV